MKTFQWLLLLFPSICFTQSTTEQQVKIDSLKQVIERAEHDTIIINAWLAWDDLIYGSDPKLDFELNNKIANHCQKNLSNKENALPSKEQEFYQTAQSKALNNIGISYYAQGDYAKATDYLFQSLSIKEEMGDKAGIASTLNNLGWIYHNQGDFEKAVEYLSKSLEISKEIGKESGIANALNNLGAVYDEQGDYPKAIAFHKQSLKISKEIGDESGIATSLNNIGSIYNNQGDYANAIDYYIQCLKIDEATGNKSDIATSLSNIGSIYGTQGNHIKAIEYYTRSLKIDEETGNKSGIATSLNNIGNIYDKQGDYTKAIEHYTQSLNINKDIGNKSGVAVSLNSIGNFYKNQKKYNEAITYYKQSLNISEDIGKKLGIARSLNNLGTIYYLQQDYPKAIQYSDKALRLAKEMGHLSTIKEAAESLYKSYKKEGKNHLALGMYETFISTRDSLQSVSNQKEVIRQEYKYAYEKKAFADSLQYEQRQKLIQAELLVQKQQSYFLIGGLVLALLFGGFIFNQFRLTRQQKSIIEDQKKLVETERDKSNQLLLNILPKDTAAELREKKTVAAKSYSMASVLFTDFIGFSAIAEKLSPEELLKELNHCFSEFDAIMQRNGIEKIKTIGDAYMAASGVPTPNNSHAKDIVKAALDIKTFMLAYADQRKQEQKPYFEIRIGINSGPLVAGVVGTQKFQYDIWGDTVNVASRMETKSKAGKVNISAVTYQLVKDEAYIFTARGKVSIKGLGEMEMYFVEFP